MAHGSPEQTLVLGVPSGFANLIVPNRGARRRRDAPRLSRRAHRDPRRHPNLTAAGRASEYSGDGGACPARVALEARTPSPIARRVRRRYVLGLPCFPRSKRRLVAVELVVVQVEHAWSASPVAAVVGGRLHGRDRPRIVLEEEIAHDAKARGARGAWQGSPIAPGACPLAPVLHYSMRSRRPQCETPRCQPLRLRRIPSDARRRDGTSQARVARQAPQLLHPLHERNEAMNY